MKIMANQILASVYPVKASTCFTCAEFELATKGLVERCLGMSVIRGRSVVTVIVSAELYVASFTCRYSHCFCDSVNSPII